MTDPGFLVVDDGEYIEIDGVSLSTAGWSTDYAPLRGGPAARRQSVVISGSPGRRQYAMYPDETTFPLEIHITGAWNPIDDVAYDDPILGLQLNIEYLRDNVCTYAPGPTTRELVWHLHDGETTRTATVQVQLEMAATGDGEYDQAGVLFVYAEAGLSGEAPAVVNDNWADAIEFDVATDTLITGDNTGYSLEDDEQLPSVAGCDVTAWWKFNPPVDGNVDLDTIGTGFDTVLAVWRGLTLATLVEVASDDDSGGGGTSATSFEVTTGTTYYVQVGGFDDTNVGPITLNVVFTPT